MMVVLLFAALFGKTYDMLSALALSAFLILLQNPLQILSAGFLLSFGAVFGIAVILPCFKKLFPSKNPLIGSLLMSTCAQITTTPFILYFFYQFPVYSILTNLIILPFVTVLTLTSILAGMTGVIWLPAGIFLVGGADYILKFYELVCKIVSRLPKNLLTVGRPGILKIVIYFLLIAVFVWIAGKYKKWYSILIPAAAFLMLLMPHANDGFEVTVLDVGQGDSIYMESEKGTTFLIDGGSIDVKRVGMNRIQPFLLSQGTDYIDFAVITHSDSDHISGLTELMGLGKIKVKNLILPNINKKDDAYLSLEALAKEKNIAVKYIKAGDHITEGKLLISCLHPAKGFEASTSNSYSTVLSVTYGEFDMLLTGDLEQGGEDAVINLFKNQELLQKYSGVKDGDGKPPTDYDILKVAHHGSKNSTFIDLLNIIRPEYALISVGRDNSYGHPNKELLNRLNKIGSKILITYNTGAITIRTDGKRMKIDIAQK
jgi:competence protein ComEC